MTKVIDQDKRTRIAELAGEYWNRFGSCIGLPFDVVLCGTWTDDDYIREYEAALASGTPFEPGTERWLEAFGEPVELEDGAVV